MDNEALFNIFKKAIYDEHTSYEFYLKAAADTTNKDAKELFAKFAAIERSHENALEELYRTLKE